MNSSNSSQISKAIFYQGRHSLGKLNYIGLPKEEFEFSLGLIYLLQVYASLLPGNASLFTPAPTSRRPRSRRGRPAEQRNWMTNRMSRRKATSRWKLHLETTLTDAPRRKTHSKTSSIREDPYSTYGWMGGGGVSPNRT